MTINSISARICFAEINVTSQVEGGTSNLTNIPTLELNELKLGQESIALDSRCRGRALSYNSGNLLCLWQVLSW